MIDPSNKVSTLTKLRYLYYIKKVDAYHGCSFGTNINSGASFLTPPLLPHGPAGIFVGHDVKVGKNVAIYQQATIAHGKVVIGDNVLLGAGSKILPNCCIRSNAKIGANCVVAENIPEFATAVLPKSRIILKQT